jgi:hypothetical protein
MALPYENTTAGNKAMADIQKILQRFGCKSFGSMNNFAEKKLIIQFEYKDRKISVSASSAGYAAAWLKEHPYNYRMKKTEIQHQREALERANTAVYSILRDWIKGQITAVECGILSLEGAFLGQILLPNGRTVLEHVEKEQFLQIGVTK